MKILIVVPCFNEDFRLKTDEFYQFSESHPNIRFLFVDDGSTDNTLNILRVLCNGADNLDFLSLKKNNGKAEAIRSGILSINDQIENYDFIGYFDADLSVPLNEILDFLEVIKKNIDVKFILGIRVARLGAHIKRNLIRHYLGRVFATIVSTLILKETIYDTQCGAKLIHKSIVIKLFEKAFISKWIFDVELICRYKIFFPKYKNLIIEYPINEWHEVRGSKLKIKHYLFAPFELFKIWFKYQKHLKY